MKRQVEIAVVGGGAAGLMAAIFAAEELEKQERPGKVIILERAQRVGKKLLATGNGRCNLTNQQASLPYYHGDAQRMLPVLERFPPSQIIRTFERFGLLCRTEEQGRVYPYNVQAAAVLDILRLRLEHYQVEICCEYLVQEIQAKGGDFTLTNSTGETVIANKVILTSGGQASPQLGSDGSGFALAEKLGHCITALAPALVGVKTEPYRAKPLKGMRSYAVVSLWIENKKVREERGEVQFTEHGLSGICVFQLSRHINTAMQENPRRLVEVSLDLMPEYGEEALAKRIAGYAKQYPSLPALELLSGMINKRVGQEIVRLTFGKAQTMQAGQCRFSDCQKLASQIKEFSFPIVGPMPWNTAQVTAGGVSCEGVNPQTMESVPCPGLYFAGEILNIDGDCGGFNLHWAWASGMLAGMSAASGNLPNCQPSRKKTKPKQGGKKR
ncbi:MAG: aminoacetone oxidase family FAD-binding enzyme [Clostridiales bacterium]|jgi:predicted Rossmann fold flavoprotein|nr:aminoacetone oxidase family FAD-binding enzyme [Clostridiales bacterium]